VARLRCTGTATETTGGETAITSAGGEARRRGPSITPAATRLSTATEIAQVVTIDLAEDFVRNDDDRLSVVMCENA
jgi:hypothetical protein